MSLPLPVVATLGVPRDVSHVVLKTASDAHRAGCLPAGDLAALGRDHRIAGWRRLKALGVTAIPSGDADLGDAVAATAAMVGAPLGTTRSSTSRVGGEPFAAPPLGPAQRFRLASTRPIAAFLEAKLIGIPTRPVLLGPASFLALSTPAEAGFDPLALLPRLLPVYGDVLTRLGRVGARRVQIDEPCLAADPDGSRLAAAIEALAALTRVAGGPEIVLAGWGGDVSAAVPDLARLPLAGLHLDLIAAPTQLDAALATWPADRILSLGVVDGRRAVIANVDRVYARIAPVAARRGTERLELAPSCPLGRLPFDLPLGADVAPEFADRLAFAADKIGELRRLAEALAEGRSPVAGRTSETTARRSRPVAVVPAERTFRVAAQ